MAEEVVHESFQLQYRAPEMGPAMRKFRDGRLEVFCIQGIPAVRIKDLSKITPKENIRFQATQLVSVPTARSSGKNGVIVVKYDNNGSRRIKFDLQFGTNDDFRACFNKLASLKEASNAVSDSKMAGVTNVRRSPRNKQATASIIDPSSASTISLGGLSSRSSATSASTTWIKKELKIEVKEEPKEEIVISSFPENGLDQEKDILFNDFLKNEPRRPNPRKMIRTIPIAYVPSTSTPTSRAKPLGLPVDVFSENIPTDKENQHRTPIKNPPQTRSESAEKRTPLADKFEPLRSSPSSSGRPRVPIITRSSPQNVSESKIAPTEKIPGIANFPSRSDYSLTTRSANSIDANSNNNNKRPCLTTSDTASDNTAKRSKIYDFYKGPSSTSTSSNHWKRSPFESKAVDKVHYKGFSNIGNTCYMNSILQALFGLASFAKELLKTFTALESHIPDTNLLLGCLSNLLCAKDSENQELKTDLLKKVKEAISSSATRFLGNEQHDAHEFLAQVLDQLRDEVNNVNDRLPSGSAVTKQPNPVETNFEFWINKSIECHKCHNIVRKEEKCNDLSLQLPLTNEPDSGNAMPLQLLLEAYFDKEQVEYRCEICNGGEHTISRKIKTVPRILTVHLKRYAFRDGTSRSVKIDKTVNVPKYLTVHRVCADAQIRATPVSESTKKLSISLPPRLAPPSSAEDRSNCSNGSGTYSAEKARRQLFGSNDDDETDESSLGRKRYSFRRDRPPPHNTRSASLNLIPLSEIDEATALEEALERSKHETGRIAGDDDQQKQESDFNQQLEEATRRSLLETSFYSNAAESTPLHHPADNNGINGRTDDEVLYLLDDEMILNAEDGHLSPAFRLCAVVNHLGIGSGSGHYVADVLHIDSDQWRSYDDNHVSEMAEDKVRRDRQRTGYIFFYMARELVDDWKSLNFPGVV